MINVAKRKLPMPVLAVLVYISYCAACWYSMRGLLANNSDMAYFLANDVFAFFLAGIMPFAILMLASSFVFRMLPRRTGGDTNSIRYGLWLAVIVANVVLFALKFIYIAVPHAAPALNIVLDPTVTAVFVGLYMVYAYKMQYVDKSRFGIVLTQVSSTFLAVYGFIAAIGLIGSIMMIAA